MPATKNIIAGLGAVGILAAGAFLGGTKDGEVEPTIDGGIVKPVQEEKKIEEVAPIAIVTPSGKKVFVVGEQRPENPVVTETDLGKVVLKNEISDNSLCNVVFEAKLTDKFTPAPHGEQIKSSEPDFGVNFGHVRPVIIPGSCDAQKNCIFNTLLKGQECLKSVDIPGYLGSTMGEFLKLPLDTQQKFLKQQGKCSVKINSETREISCTVPVGDPRANADAPVIFNHSWSGRQDINPMQASKKDGKFVAVDRADVYMGTAEDNRGIPKSN